MLYHLPLHEPLLLEEPVIIDPRLIHTLRQADFLFACEMLLSQVIYTLLGAPLHQFCFNLFDVLDLEDRSGDFLLFTDEKSFTRVELELDRVEMSHVFYLKIILLLYF